MTRAKKDFLKSILYIIRRFWGCGISNHFFWHITIIAVNIRKDDTSSSIYVNLANGQCYGLFQGRYLVIWLVYHAFRTDAS